MTPIKREVIRADLFKRYPKLNRARRACLGSDMKPRLGAVVVRNGDILGEANNKNGLPMGLKLPKKRSRCAEHRAIQHKDVRGATVYVYREHGITGMPLDAAPCGSCQRLLKRAGVRKVVFTISDAPYYDYWHL